MYKTKIIMIARIFNHKYKSLVVMAFLLLGVFIYSNTLQGSFHYDDNISIVDNFAIKNIRNPQAIWNFWPTRFITYLSLALNYYFGQLNVTGYHLFNLAVHLGAAFLFWWFMLLTFSTPAMKGEKISRQAHLIAFFAGLVFLTHPIQTQAVTYIIQRTTSLATLLYLACLCLYVKSSLLQQEGKSPKLSGILYCGSLITAVMAMFTKEIAVTLPFVVLFYEACFLKAKGGLNWKRLFPILATILIIPLTMLLTKFVDIMGMRMATEAPLDIPRGHYLLSELRVMATYIRLLFVPINQNLDYNYSIAKSLLEAPVLASLIFLIFILIAAIRIFSKYRLISFGIFWFFLTLLPESSIIPIRDLIFEHRLYLPMAGFSIFLVSSVYYLFENKNLKTMVAALVIIISCYSILTYTRNFIWKDEFTLWSDTVRKSPGKARPYYNRGFAYQNKGDFDLALSDFNKAIELSPGDSAAYYVRGLAYLIQHKPKQAILDFNKAIELSPGYAAAYNNRGLAYESQRDFTRAILDFNKVIEINPKFGASYNNRGFIYQIQGNLDQAILDYNKAIELNLNYAPAYYNRGIVYQIRGNLKQSLSDYDKSIELNPSYAPAHYNRGIIYQVQGDFTRALSDFSKAIELSPKDAPAYYVRGLAYQSRGNFKQALSDYDKAIELKPDYAAAYNNRGLAYESQGDFDRAILDYNKTIELAPDSALVYNNRAVAHFLKKDYNKAWEDMHKAEAMGHKVDPVFLKDLKKASGRER